MKITLNITSVLILLLITGSCTGPPRRDATGYNPNNWHRGNAEIRRKKNLGRNLNPIPLGAGPKVFSAKFLIRGYLPGADVETQRKCLDELSNHYTTVFNGFYKEQKYWPDQEVLDFLASKMKIILLRESRDLENAAFTGELKGKLVPYRDTWADFSTGEVAIVYNDTWENTRGLLMPALVRIFLYRLSNRFPAWVAEGLVPVYTSGVFKYASFFPVKRMPVKILRSIVRLIDSKKTPSIQQLRKKNDEEFSESDRLASCGIVLWFMNRKSGRRVFESYLRKLIKGTNGREYLDKIIKGREKELDKKWQDWFHEFADSQGAYIPIEE